MPLSWLVGEFSCKKMKMGISILVHMYLSQTFSTAECNYNIYDHELLAVIHALDHWHHYLQGTCHPVTLLTDHKNLTYFRQLQNLSRRQAHWMMFLQDFDLHFIHVPGSAMGPANALSCIADPDTSSDKTNVTLLLHTLRPPWYSFSFSCFYL